MIYTVYFNRDEIFGDRIGHEELEHYALVKYFSPLLRERGTLVRLVEHVKRQVDSISLVAECLGEKNIFISFSAPNADYLELSSGKLFIGSIYKRSKKYYSGQVKVASDSILRNGLQQSIAMVSTCPNSLLSIEDLHRDLPSIAIPPPLWDYYSKLNQELDISSSSLKTDGYVISNQLKGCRAKHIKNKIPLNRKLHSVSSAIKKGNLMLAIEYLFRRGLIYFEPTTLVTEGIVYTTIIGANNPFKSYKAIITAFGKAFKSTANVTLIIKMAGRVRKSQKRRMLKLLKSKTCNCSIIIINEHLSQLKYEQLIRATHFVINSSCTDEIGNSLLEFMSAGKPLISPPLSNHPSFSNENTFFMKKSDEYKASLEDQLLRSYKLVNDDPQAYYSMSKASAKSMSEYCSVKQVRPLFNEFLNQLDI